MRGRSQSKRRYARKTAQMHVWQGSGERGDGIRIANLVNDNGLVCNCACWRGYSSLLPFPYVLEPPLCYLCRSHYPNVENSVVFWRTCTGFCYVTARSKLHPAPCPRVDIMHANKQTVFVPPSSVVTREGDVRGDASARSGGDSQGYQG